MVKIKKLIFILVIGDGGLTKNYLDNKSLVSHRKELLKHEKLDGGFPLNLYVFSEIMALRLLIPKSPSFILTDKKIINTSMNTMVNDPEEFYKVDNRELEKVRDDILNQFGVQTS